tara:strand:+ start:110 stop:559 length:450 start_codon:yes stop_codon:yes gene_type:complete
MGIAEHWGDLQFSLECLNKGNAKRQFRHAIKYAFGGLCAYCRCARATTLDHIKPRSKGGSNLRSNLVPACTECNHSKGSENWLVWYQRQEFYSKIVEELIDEWIENKYYDLEDDEPGINDRTAVCSDTSTLRSEQDEPPSVGKNCLAPA